MKKINNNQLWIKKINETYRIGLTNVGQDDFGSVTFVMLPKVGDVLDKNDTFAELEAEKAVTELVMPCKGTVCEVNPAVVKEALALDNPVEEEAWLISISDVSEEDLLALA